MYCYKVIYFDDILIYFMRYLWVFLIIYDDIFATIDTVDEKQYVQELKSKLNRVQGVQHTDENKNSNEKSCLLSKT